MRRCNQSEDSGQGSRRGPRLFPAMGWKSVCILVGFVLSLAGVSSAEKGRPWGEGYFPDVLLTTHEGKQVRFYQDLLKDKVVAINFMFTSCENVCPAETARLSQVASLLGDRVGEDVHFYSISIDPEVDTPEALARYRERFDVGEGWTFLTASRETSDLIQRKLGLLVEELDDPNDHDASLVLGNEANGRWIRRSPYDNPKSLAQLLAESLQNGRRPTRANRTLASYADAPSRSNWGKGERIYRSRCAACHTVGEGNGLGPDLAGITQRREREWLVRWIVEPDLMISEKDPDALELLQAWDDIRMPNFGLDQAEAEAILGFIERSSPSPSTGSERSLSMRESVGP